MADGQREMTLQEWVETLPECHRARAELVLLRRDLLNANAQGGELLNEIERLKQLYDEHSRRKRLREESLPGVECHAIDILWRTNPPLYEQGPEWSNGCMRAILDALLSEGVIAWSGDGTCCVLQIVTAFAKREAEALKRLPAEMQECTIQYMSCEKGHGRLTASNWNPHECHWCEIDRLREELAKWKPMSPEEAQKAYDEAEAVPLSDEEIQAIVKRATDPAETLTNSQQMQLAADNKRLRAAIAGLLTGISELAAASPQVREFQVSIWQSWACVKEANKLAPWCRVDEAKQPVPEYILQCSRCGCMQRTNLDRRGSRCQQTADCAGYYFEVQPVGSYTVTHA